MKLKKNYKSTNKNKKKTENSRKKYSPNKFLPVRRNRIALQSATLKEDTSRYQGNANKI
jgi:hypothetical protein